MNSRFGNYSPVRARSIRDKNFGSRVKFYYPGMIRFNGKLGLYPAISITGTECALSCAHCSGRLLQSMIPALKPADLLHIAKRIESQKMKGILISGGCATDGSMPWDAFIPAIQKIKQETCLKVSLHCGLLDRRRARQLKETGIDQVLMDVTGDESVWKKVYGIAAPFINQVKTIEYLMEYDIPLVPHIIAGLNFGGIKGEFSSLILLRQYPLEILVIVVIMPLCKTEMASVTPPTARELEPLFCATREWFPRAEIALGCARPRNATDIEKLALDCGFNRLTIPDDQTENHARNQKLTIEYHRTCCSVMEEMHDEN